MKMNFLYSISLVFVFAAVVSTDNDFTPTNHLEQQILSLLNKWRKGAVETNLFPLPSLKTINMGQIDNSYSERGIKMTFSIKDLKLTGLNNFCVQHLNVTQFSDDIFMAGKLTVPKLALTSDHYNLTGRAYYIYPLKGSGKMEVAFQNVTTTFKVLFSGINNYSTRITGFTMDYGIRKVEAKLENSSWPINQVLNKDGVEILENYHEDIVKAVWSDVVPQANQYLDNISPEQFIQIISEMSMNSHLIPDT